MCIWKYILLCWMVLMSMNYTFSPSRQDFAIMASSAYKMCVPPFRLTNLHWLYACLPECMENFQVEPPNGQHPYVHWMLFGSVRLQSECMHSLGVHTFNVISEQGQMWLKTLILKVVICKHQNKERSLPCRQEGRDLVAIHLARLDHWVHFHFHLSSWFKLSGN